MKQRIVLVMTPGKAGNRLSKDTRHRVPAKYYRDNVTGGPGAFVLVAKDFNSFGTLLIRKLIAEIALIGPHSELLPR
jgi:hypothetical protein